MTNDDVASALDEIGTLLALKGENDFKCRAYHAAARHVSQLPDDINRVVAANQLGSLPGVGDAIRDKIATLVTTGRLPFLEDLRASFPVGVFDMLRLPGIGPKKVRALYDGPGIDSLDKLLAACVRGDVAKLKGFGPKTQENIMAGIAFLKSAGTRVRFDVGLPVGAALLERVRAIPGVARAELCGSLRRRCETVGNVDLVASTESPESVLAAFGALPGVDRVFETGPAKAIVSTSFPVGDRSVALTARLRTVSDHQFGAAVLYATGSTAHNARLRERAAANGLQLTEFGLTAPAGELACETEDDVYAALGLIPIPPELREDTGEVEAAAANALPALVRADEIRGVFHNHTTASDGSATLEQMARAARDLGFEYFGIGDHSMSLTVANGLSPDRVRQQWAEIDALNAGTPGFRILKGTEADILSDGSVDFPDDVLAGFDYVVVSVHTNFGMPEAEMTARVCKALSHPAVTMLGHATGRLLLRREGYKIALDEVIRTAAKYGKMIEINAQPHRLDLDWTHVKKAKAMGVPIVINPDAHGTDEVALYRHGVDVARRGWLTSADVFNTRPLSDVMKELERRKAAWVR